MQLVVQKGSVGGEAFNAAQKGLLSVTYGL